MLTDIFVHRYENVPLRESFEDRDRRLMVQLFRLLEEQVCPYWQGGNVSMEGKAFWGALNKQLSLELGMVALSDEWFRGPGLSRKPEVTVCRDWMLSEPAGSVHLDTFIKERLSLAELGFRSRGNWLALKARELSGVVHSDLIKLAASLKVPETPSFERQSRLERAFGAAIEELNERLRRAGYPLHYHNGFLQFSDDKVIAAEIEEPFWNLVSGATWGNVDTDMKEAIDRRDTGGRDPALYAARALESAIKIISGEKGWTHGKEKGAHNFIENLASRGNGHFIEVWEGDQLKSFFTHVRNPLGHGPGGEDMPSLTGPQTDWAIAFCMAWIKSLIART